MRMFIQYLYGLGSGIGLAYWSLELLNQGWDATLGVMLVIVLLAFALDAGRWYTQRGTHQ